MTIITPKISLSIGTEPQIGLTEHKVLFIMPYTNNEYRKDIDIDTLEDSHLKNMCLKFREINKLSKISYLGVKQDGLTNAVATLKVLNGIDVGKSIKISILDVDTIISIPNNQSIIQICNLISTELMNNKYVDSVVVDFDTLTITLNDLLMGALGNNVYFNINDLVNFELTQFTGGTEFTDYDLTPISQDRYQSVVLSNVFDEVKLSLFLTDRFNVENVLLDGVGFKAFKDYRVDNTNNSQCFVKLSVFNPVNHIDAFSTIFVGLRALRLTQGSNLASLNDTSAGSSNISGGINMSSIPYHNTNLNKYLKIDGDYVLETSNELENKRLTTIGLDVSGVNIIISDTLTGYKVDKSGNDDETFKYLNNVDIALNTREYFFNSLKAKTKQSTMVLGSAISNRGQLSKDSIKTMLISDYLTLIQEGIVQNEIDFKKNLIVEFDNLKGLIQLQYYIFPVQGVRIINGNLIVKI